MVHGKKKIRLGLILGMVLGILFASLMAVRLGLFHRVSRLDPADTAAVAQRETWMAIDQKDRRIGYAHRRLDPTQNGFTLTDTTTMRINTMGMVQDLSIETRATLNSDLSLKGFDFSLTSSLFSFQASGQVEGDALVVTMDGKQVPIALESPIFLSAGILDAAAGSKMTPGDTRTFSVFDPATLGRRPVRITLRGPETLQIDGKHLETRRFDVDFMGSAQSAWVDGQGNVIREKGFMDITLTRVTRAQALDGAPLSASQDLTRLVAVAADRHIAEPQRLTVLRLKVDGITNPLSLDGDRQRYRGGELTVRREPVPDPDQVPSVVAAEFLMPAPFIESDHPRILETVGKIVSPDDRPLARVEKIMRWIHDNIQRRPVLSVPDAVQTLIHGMGDCNEHAVLFAAMARAAGIPARIEAGLVYLRGNFYYHAWNSLYLGQWVTADALMTQLPADVTHIRFVHGAADRQIDLMQVIGKVRFSILELSDD
ncbi:MAG: transglutaminase domain-containing protein [Desulfobacterales bacterium]|nr:transglutaminase domain-containing protein [Desulfobacterales bacterium]